MHLRAGAAVLLVAGAVQSVAGCAAGGAESDSGTTTHTGTSGSSGAAATTSGSMPTGGPGPADGTGSTGAPAGTGDESGGTTGGDEGDGIDCDARVPAFADGHQLVTHPFEGVCFVHRTTTVPRPLSYYVAIIDPQAPGIAFTVTPENGREPRETTLQTTRAFLEQESAQLAVNANFFGPFPSVDAYAEVGGIAASEGVAYSPFSDGHPFGLNITADNEVAVVHHAPDDDTGFVTVEKVTLHDAVGAREQILTGGVNTADWPEQHPRTGAGVTADGELVLLLVDGRQEAISEGVTTTEMGEIFVGFGVVDAINLDGGGSSTLAVADPVARLGNVVSGLAVERLVGNSLAVFATPWHAPGPADERIAYEPFDYPHRDWSGTEWPVGGGVVNLLGGEGWASAWRDDYTHTRASGIAVYPADAGTDGDARTAPLGYTDGAGASLVTEGGQMRTSFGTSSSAWRVLDLTRVDEGLLTASGQLGASGTTVWLSMLAQSHSGLGDDRWAYVELGDVLRVGRLASTDGNWGLEVEGGAAQTGTVSSAEAAFLVVRIDFADASDSVSVWVNPELQAVPGEPDLAASVPELELSRVVIEGRYSTDLDELRIGTTWAAVAPIEP